MRRSPVQFLPSAVTSPTAPEGSLSYNQEAMWFSSSVNITANVASNIPVAMEIHASPLPLAPLMSSLSAICARHGALRTAYVDGALTEGVTGEVQTAAVSAQELAPSEAAATPELRFHDIRGLDAEAVALRVSDAANAPFDLSVGLLLRIDVFTTADADEASRVLPVGAILLITFHHIAVDLWSLVLLFDELKQRLGVPVGSSSAASLAQLTCSPTLSYADHARVQRSLPPDLELSRYWETELGGELPVLALPTDLPRPPVKTYSAAATRFTLPPDIAERVRQLARAEGVTLYTLLLAAWACILHRYTGQDDMLIGTPMAGRSKLELEAVVGYFVNPVCVRVRPATEMPFSALLESVRQTVLGAMLHQDYPFSVLVERLLADAPRDLSRSPLFQVV